MSLAGIPDATEIRDLLRRNNHTKWGFVIYRCTYADDNSWARFMEILNERAEYSLARQEGQDLYPALDWNVQEDREALEGASKDNVRQRFKAWTASDAAKAEQPQGAFQGYDDTMRGSSPRYDVCIHVDADALDSVVNRATQPPEPDLDGVGYVNMIYADWEPGVYDEETGEKLGADDLPPVDGCTEEEVGWMKVAVDGLLPAAYATLQNSGMWYDIYVRPPEVYMS